MMHIVAQMGEKLAVELLKRPSVASKPCAPAGNSYGGHEGRAQDLVGQRPGRHGARPGRAAVKRCPEAVSEAVLHPFLKVKPMFFDKKSAEIGVEWQSKGCFEEVKKR